MNLTEHFTFKEMTRTDRAEFQDENRREGLLVFDTLKAVCAELEKLRMFLFRPIIINSGFRCQALNKAVGGAPTSQHMQGGAADFTVVDFKDPHGLQFIFDWCANHIEYSQLILEKPEGRTAWVHLGIPRPGRQKRRFVFEKGVYRPV